MCMYACIYVYILPSHKKNKILPFATTCTDLEGIMLSGISQTENNKYHIIPLIYGFQNPNEANKKP